MFWRLAKLLLGLWLICTRARATFATRSRPLDFTAKDPSLTVGLDEGIGRIVVSWAWEFNHPFILCEILSLRSSNTELRCLLVDNVDVRWVCTGSRDSLCFLGKNFWRRLQSYGFWGPILSDYTFWFVLSWTWSLNSFIWWRSWATSETKVWRRLLNLIQLLKRVLAWPRHRLVKLGEPAFVAKLCRCGLKHFPWCFNIVLSGTRYSGSMSKIIEFEAAEHPWRFLLLHFFIILERVRKHSGYLSNEVFRNLNQRVIVTVA